MVFYSSWLGQPILYSSVDTKKKLEVAKLEAYGAEMQQEPPSPPPPRSVAVCYCPSPIHLEYVVQLSATSDPNHTGELWELASYKLLFPK